MEKTEYWLHTYDKEMRKYSRYIAGNELDAEDLYQETALRLVKAMDKDKNRPITKAFIFRLAQNAWTDHLRKHNQTHLPLDHFNHDGLVVKDDNTLELLELLAEQLAPRALVVMLLMDVFRFTARETAALIDSTEGAVQIVLSRARKKLRTLRQFKEEEVHTKQAAESERLDQNVLSEIAHSFRSRNAHRIAAAFVRLSKQGAHMEHIRMEQGRLFFTITDPDGNSIMITSTLS